MRRPGPKSHVDVGSVPSKSGGYLGRGGEPPVLVFEIRQLNLGAILKASKWKEIFELCL